MPFEMRIMGLAELQRGLKAADAELLKAFRDDMGEVAQRVAGSAQARVPSKSGRARASVRAGVVNKGAYVAGGRASVKYFGWLDFGSRNAVSGRPRTVGPWRGSGAGPKGGRFIYPAIDQHQADIERGASRAVDKAMERALG